MNGNRKDSHMDGLDQLALGIRSCIKCGEMVIKENKRTGERTFVPLVKIPEGKTSLLDSSENPVPGKGNPHATYMVIGEAPGENEDEHGAPFIGSSGKYLKNRLLPTLAGIRVSDCWFTNLVKCHPQHNRNPLANEIKACAPWLETEIQLVQPKVILAVGAFASKYFTDMSLKDGHGQVFMWNNIPVIPLYHPAAVNRSVTRKGLEADYRTILSVLHDSVGEGGLIRPDENDFTLIDNGMSLLALLTILEGESIFALDIETNESEYSRTRGKPDPITNELAGIAITIEKQDENGVLQYPSYYIVLTSHPDSELTPNLFGDSDGDSDWDETRMYVCSLLKPIVRKSTIIMHNAKFEMQSLDKYELYFRNTYDTILGAYEINQDTMGLKDIIRRVFGVTMHELDSIVDLKRNTVGDAPLGKMFPYACADSSYTFRLMRHEEREMAKL